jgi:hypothetical protein
MSIIMSVIFYTRRAIGPISQQGVARYDFEDESDFFPDLPRILRLEAKKAMPKWLAVRSATFFFRVTKDCEPFVEGATRRVLTVSITVN